MLPTYSVSYHAYTYPPLDPTYVYERRTCITIAIFLHGRPLWSYLIGKRMISILQHTDYSSHTTNLLPEWAELVKHSDQNAKQKEGGYNATPNFLVQHAQKFHQRVVDSGFLHENSQTDQIVIWDGKVYNIFSFRHY